MYVCMYVYIYIYLFMQDMSGHKKLSMRDVEGLVKQAKELDSRFDKGAM